MEKLGEGYQPKIVTFDSQTQIKQMTLREILWSDFKQNGKPPVCETKISEIFGGTKTKLKNAFLNNGLNFNPLEERMSCEVTSGNEKIIEIGDVQFFKNTHFVTPNHLELMISENGYRLSSLLGGKSSMCLIQTCPTFTSKYPMLWEYLQSNFNAPVAFVFITDNNLPQMIPQIDTEKLCEASYNYLLTSLNKWKINTEILEKYYKCLHYNVLI